MHTESMPNVLIRGVPADVHQALLRKASKRHQSLQQYLSTELRRLAEKEPISDVLDEIDAEQGGRIGFLQAVEAIHNERARR